MSLQDKIRDAERGLATIDFQSANRKLDRVLKEVENHLYHATSTYRKYGRDIDLYCGRMSEVYGNVGLRIGAETFTLGARLSIKDGGYHIRDPLGDFRSFIAYDDFRMGLLSDMFEQQFGDQIVEMFIAKASKRIDCWAVVHAYLPEVA